MFKTGGWNKLIETADIRALSKISYWRGGVAIGIDWLIIVGSVFFGLQFKHPAVYFVCWFVIGTRMYALYSLLHDGMHYLLFPNKRVNDWLCRLFLAWPLFVSLHKIRKYHFAHHQHLKTPADPEAVHLDYKEFQFPQKASELFFVFLKDITGINFIFYKVRKTVKILSLLFYPAENKTDTSPSSRLGPDSGIVIYYMVVISLLVYTGYLGSFILYWVIPYISIYQFLNRLRLATEHFYIPPDKPFQTRTVKLNFVQQFVFSPHHLGFHTEHHLFPSVPHYRLPALHQRLMDKKEFRENMLMDESYFQVILKYVK